MVAEAALVAAPEVVREPEQRDRCNPRVGEADDPADERQPEAAVVRRLRAEGEQDVPELAASMDEAGEIADGGAMLELELDLAELEAGSKRIDRHPRLDAEAGREREAGGSRRRREDALPGERLTRRSACRELDQASRGSLREPEAAALRAREPGDDEIAVSLDERRQVAAQIGVAEQQATRRCGALRDRQRLALAAVREPEHPRAGDRRRMRGRIARAVVGDDHLHAWKARRELCDRSRRSAPPRRAPRSGSSGDRQPPAPDAASGSIGGRMPSSAVSRIP